jgi:hypothetical protein
MGYAMIDFHTHPGKVIYNAPVFAAGQPPWFMNLYGIEKSEVMPDGF